MTICPSSVDALRQEYGVAFGLVMVAFRIIQPKPRGSQLRLAFAPPSTRGTGPSLACPCCSLRDTPSATPAPAAGPVEPGWRLAPIDDAARHAFGLDRNLSGVIVTQLTPDGPTAQAGLAPGDVVVEIQQEKVAGVEDVAGIIALARQQRRRYVAVLAHNAEGLRWLAVSLD